MKNLLIAALAATATAMSASADVTTVKTLFEGSQDVTWENTLRVEKEQFAEGVVRGNYISVELTNPSTDGTDVELKSKGVWLPGSVKIWYDGTPEAATPEAREVRLYLTQAGLDTLKEDGLEICGPHFTVTKVTLCDDGFQMPEKAIWGGYFWISNWNTLELFKTAFDTYQGERYMNINLSDDGGDWTGYFIQVMTKFDSPQNLWFANDKIDHQATAAVCDFQNNSLGVATWDMTERIGEQNTVLFQSNPEKEGLGYNLTSIVFDNNAISSVVNSIGSYEETCVNVYNMQGHLLKSSVSSETAAEGLPAGLYIIGAKKVMVK